MYWAACNLAYYGFLWSAEFMVPNLASFSAALHLGVQDIPVDSDTNPSCLHTRFKASKTDPFWKSCFIHTRQGRFPLCALQAVMLYLSIRGNLGGPLIPAPVWQALVLCFANHLDLTNYSGCAFLATFRAIASALEQHGSVSLQWHPRPFNPDIRTLDQ